MDISLLIFWLIGITGGVSLASLGSRKLGVCLFFLVPFAAELVFLLFPDAEPKMHLSEAMQDVRFWTGLLIVYIYGLVLEGGWAVLLGELGWFAIRAASLPSKFSLRSLTIAGAFAGGLMGALLAMAVHGLALGQMVPIPSAWELDNSWFLASLVGGALGGILVAYYAVKEPRPQNRAIAAALQA